MQYIAANSEIQVISGGKKVSSVLVSYAVQSLAVSVQGLLAVGAAVRLHVLDLSM